MTCDVILLWSVDFVNSLRINCAPLCRTANKFPPTNWTLNLVQPSSDAAPLELQEPAHLCSSPGRPGELLPGCWGTPRYSLCRAPHRIPQAGCQHAPVPPTELFEGSTPHVGSYLGSSGGETREARPPSSSGAGRGAPVILRGANKAPCALILARSSTRAEPPGDVWNKKRRC